MADTERLAQTIAGRDVEGILSGRIHRDRVSSFPGVPLLVGQGQRFAMDVRAGTESIRMLQGGSFAVCMLPAPALRRTSSLCRPTGA